MGIGPLTAARVMRWFHKPVTLYDYAPLCRGCRVLVVSFGGPEGSYVPLTGFDWLSCVCRGPRTDKMPDIWEQAPCAINRSKGLQNLYPAVRFRPAPPSFSEVYR